jgi:hypothetical protein
LHPPFPSAAAGPTSTDSTTGDENRTMTVLKPTLTALCLALFAFSAAAETASPTAAAKAFMLSLSGSERSAAIKDFDDSDRKAWRFTPGSRGGLTVGAMDKETFAAAMALLRTVLSEKGISLIAEVRKREAALDTIEGGSGYRNPENYYLALFGEPGAAKWALRFEGHHLTINVTLSKDRIVSVLPFAFGSNPDRLPESGKRLVVEIIAGAEQAVAGGAREIATALDTLLAAFPPEIASTTRAAITPKLAAGSGGGSGGDYRIEAKGASFWTEVQATNHYHIQLSDEALNFGGR